MMWYGLIEWVACGVVALLALWPGPIRWPVAVLALLGLWWAWTPSSAQWFLSPLVLAVVLLAFVAIRPKPKRRVARLFALLLVGVAAAVCWLLPVPLEPKLPGSHGVGTLTVTLPEEAGSAQLVVQLWYPSDQAFTHDPIAWLPDSSLVPGFPFNRIARSRVSARKESPPTFGEKPLKVLFYEHGWMGHGRENVAQVEALASEGYVVVAIDHPENLSGDPPMSTPQEIADFKAQAERLIAARLEQIERVRVALGEDLAENLSGHLDLESVGVFGFSFGGTTAIRLCATNPYFIAGANEDGLFLGDEKPGVPFFFFDDEMPAWLLAPPAPGENAYQVFIRESDRKIQEAMPATGNHRLSIEGASHESFTDRIFLCRIPRLAKAGKKPAAEMHRILVDNLSDFFKEALR